MMVGGPAGAGGIITVLNWKLQNYNAHAIRVINILGFIISQDFFPRRRRHLDIHQVRRSETPHYRDFKLSDTFDSQYPHYCVQYYQ